MNAENILAILSTLLIYVIFAVAYFGWGRLVVTQLSFNNQQNDSITYYVWIGWAFSLLIFQMIHFILPLNAFAVIPIFITGVFFSILYILKKKENDSTDRLKQLWPILLFVFIISTWIASHSMLPATNYDSGLYHFNIIKWINTYAIVPGLGNLHGRFAFNQSFFTYVAVLNFSPFFNHGRSIANSFLFILALITIIELLYPVIKKPSLIIKLHPFQYLPGFFILPMLAFLALSSDGLSSPSPDLTSMLLQLIMFVILADSLGKWIQGDCQQNNTAMLLAILAATAITIKLSNLVFSMVIIGIIIVYVFQLKNTHLSTMFRIFFPASLIISVFIIRGYILSGTPLYPSSIGYGWIDLDWAISLEKIINEANWVYSWARQQNTHWKIVLENWDWFKPWLDNILSHHRIAVVYPLLLTIIFYSITIILNNFKKMRKLKLAEIFIILPPVFSLLFWFFTAPDLRFANASIFLVFLSSFLLLFSYIQSIASTKMKIIITMLVFIMGSGNLAGYFYNNPERIIDISESGWHANKKVPLINNVTKSGLEVYKPEKGDQCWDSPIPCAPGFNNNLQLRIQDDISSGFMVK